MSDMKKFNSRKSEKGAAIIYIMIAIALVAALSYAVSKSNRGGVTTLTGERAKLAAQEIVEYGNTVAQAVQKLRLRGCSDTQISFENSVIAGYTNASSPSDSTCHVYNPNGGSIKFVQFDDTFYENPGIADDLKLSINGDNIVTDNGSSNAELVLFITDIKENICTNAQRIVNSDDTAFTGTDFAAGASKFTGTYSGSPNTVCNTSADTADSGCCQEVTGCNGGSCYHYYQVLIAR